MHAALRGHNSHVWDRCLVCAVQLKGTALQSTVQTRCFAWMMYCREMVPNLQVFMIDCRK
jgi:hypothetical protein